MMGFGMGFLGILLMILFWGGLIALAVWLITLLFPISEQSAGQQAQSQSALAILDSRYTKGELTREEYLQMKNEIQAK